MPVLKLAWAARQQWIAQFAIARLSVGYRRIPSGPWKPPRKNLHRIDVWWREAEADLEASFMTDLSND